MRKICLTLSMLLCSYLLFAQQTYTVKIVDSRTGAPVPNASVKVISTGKGMITNADGTNTITAKANDVLEITCIGYKDQAVSLGAQSTVTVAMESSSVDILDVVVVVHVVHPGQELKRQYPLTLLR